MRSTMHMAHIITGAVATGLLLTHRQQRNKEVTALKIKDGAQGRWNLDYVLLCTQLRNLKSSLPQDVQEYFTKLVGP